MLALAAASLVTLVGGVKLARAQEVQPDASLPPEVILRWRAGQQAKRVVILEPFAADSTDGEALRHAGEMHAVVDRDLEYSGIFRVQEPLAPDASLAEQAAPPSGECVISAAVRRAGRDLRLDGVLTDPLSGRRIASFSHDFDAVSARWTAHRYSDDIVYALTGEEGIARTRLAFVAKTADGQELYLVDYDGEGLERLTNDRSIAVSPAWSPDGGAILYTSYKRGTAAVYWVRPDGSEGGPVSQQPGLNIAPAWAADGKRIALSLSKDGNTEIYSMRRDGTGLSRLTSNGAIDTSPTWAPTGLQLAFTSDRSGSPQIYLMDAGGANQTRATFEGDYNASPAWSPRGEGIAYVSRTTSGFDLYLLDLASLSTIPVTKGSGLYEDPDWAPNARHLAAAKGRGGIRSIVVMQFDGSEERTITPRDLDALSPSWSPIPK